MENLRPDSMEGSEVPAGEDDSFYEAIEAPKFVDLSNPDRSRPDTRFWFCERVGCDLMHEDVDPEALNRSFLLRVMAARSPNIKLRRTLSKCTSSIPKCPKSAPAKHPKDRISKLSTVTGIPVKLANKKIKEHPISKLRSTSLETQTPTAKKALTTPRSKKCPTSNLEMFRSVKHQKEPGAASKNPTIVKALFGKNSKEEDGRNIVKTSKTPVTKVCCELKKLELGGSEKNVKNTKEIAHEKIDTLAKKKSNAAINIAEECIPLTDNASTCSLKSRKSSKEEISATSESGGDRQIIECASDYEDNKENVSETSTIRSLYSNTDGTEISHADTNETFSSKGTKATLRSFSEKNAQAVKRLKPTNPKPFKLRTDERGILKEANLERRLQREAKKGPSEPLKNGNRSEYKTKTTAAKAARVGSMWLPPKSPHSQKFTSSSRMTNEGRGKKISTDTLPRYMRATKSTISHLSREKETCRNFKNDSCGRKHSNAIGKQPISHRTHS